MVNIQTLTNISLSVHFYFRRLQFCQNRWCWWWKKKTSDAPTQERAGQGADNLCKLEQSFATKDITVEFTKKNYNNNNNKTPTAFHHPLFTFTCHILSNWKQQTDHKNREREIAQKLLVNTCSCPVGVIILWFLVNTDSTATYNTAFPVHPCDTLIHCHKGFWN